MNTAYFWGFRYNSRTLDDVIFAPYAYIIPEHRMM
jgi:hypothetical protein